MASDTERSFTPLHQARRMLGEKAYREAHAYCRKIAQDTPSNADAFYILGIISYEHNDFPRALKLFEVAIQNKHPEPGPFVQAARCLGHLNRPKEALEYVEAAKRLAPKDGFTLSSIGALLSRLDRHEEAVIFHRKATQAAPENAMNFFNLGSALQFIGDAEDAIDAYKKALDIAPNYTPALVHLTMMTKSTKANNNLPTLKSAWDGRRPQDIEGGLQIAHAIAKIHEDLSDPATAMDWLDKGKALVRKAIPHRRDADAVSFTAAQNLAKQLKYDTSDRPDGPIFIVGLPRTGTTLLDRIISSHSKIVSAGERTEFGARLHQSTGLAGQLPTDSETIAKAAEINLSQVGTAYIENVSAILEGNKRFTDKMPINALLAPAILGAIPSARIICLRRNPADSVLSMYRQLFALHAMIYRCAYSLDDLAHYVAQFYDMVESFEAALPSQRFTVMDYENLVGAPETQIRRILDFCNLDFEPACLSFQDNTAPVGTASVAQVRQPLYSSAVGRWKRYEAHLESALEILRERGKLRA